MTFSHEHARWCGGLYVHVPFCERKCAYCDFYSVEDHSGVEDVLSAMEVEIRLAAEEGRGMKAGTVYLGGGTPSILTVKQLSRIMESLHRSFSIDPHAEFTIEVNPGTVTPQSLADYRALGCNRLSIGVQSFDDAELGWLGRIHSAEQARRCFAEARAAGFDNISIDLISSLPGQTEEQCVRSLEEAVRMQPEHISAYTLIVEDNTPLSAWVKEGRVTPNAEVHESQLFVATMALLAKAGFEHYEVSNYAQPGRRSRHNSAYWNHTSYLGFGPSAHSFLWKRPGSEARRWANVRSIRAYVDRLRAGTSPLDHNESLNDQQLLDEAIFLGLRSDGLDFSRIERMKGSGLTDRQRDTLRNICDAGLATCDGQRVRLTPKGFLLCDEICARVLIP
jgi:oxygen-independent coproporphyrinogen-3 oxidase